VSGWAAGASYLSLGLTVGEHSQNPLVGPLSAWAHATGQTMAVAIVGNLLVVCLILCTAQVGAYWSVPAPTVGRSSEPNLTRYRHVGFPMWNRVVWGLRLAYFPLANRIVLSFTWSATQGWFGGQCLKVRALSINSCPVTASLGS
jgi:NCS1 family nucleobase:cation symporter-1